MGAWKQHGVELELTLLPFDGMRFFGTFGHRSNRCVKNKLPNEAGVAIDNCRLHSSQWTGFLSARYETQPLDLGLASGSFGLQVDWAPRQQDPHGLRPRRWMR